MAGGQRRGRGTGLVRRLHWAALLLLPAGYFPALAATTPSAVPSTAAAPAMTAPPVKIAKPSAYHALEAAPVPAKPLPKPVAAPARHPAVTPGQARQNRIEQAHLQPAQPPQRQLPLSAHGTTGSRPTPHYQEPHYREPQPPAQARVEPPHAVPQPLQAEAQQPPRVSESYGPPRLYPDPGPRAYPPYGQPRYTRPMMTAYPETAPPPFARRVLYQGNNYPGNTGQRRENGQNATEHLPAWMRKHQNESPAERERSLRLEPGFNRLPPMQQQSLINTLHHLDEMPPEQRERTLMRMENMERLSPQMREAVRSSARQLNEMAPERRRLWQKAFRDLENMPPEQRQEILRSQEFAGQFSAQERSIMGNLLAVEPYRNPGPMEAPPLYGK